MAGRPRGSSLVGVASRGENPLARPVLACLPAAGTGHDSGVINGLIRRGDRVIGNLLESGIQAHHRRRLAKLGHRESIVPETGSEWAGGDPPPRAGNSLEVLIDGENVLPAIEEAIRGARDHVHIAGWSITPKFALTRGDDPEIVHGLLAQTARKLDVRVLLWAGAPFPVVRPDRRDVRRDRDALTRGSNVQVGLDPREHLIHCHHEKIVVVDDEVAFVGGLDLTDRDGDRFDRQAHPHRERLGWHDLAFRIRGPLVADAARHFLQRWCECTGERLPQPAPQDPAGEVEAQFVRTVPEGVYSFAPQGEFRILESYLRALRSAQSLIYIENQFLWAPEIVSVLADKLRRPPSPDFRVVVILPSRANQGEEDTRGQLQFLLDADGGAERFTASTISAVEGDNVERVYVHAKVAIVDDRWLTIGSANLNGRGLFNDTEANVVTHDPGLARQTRLRLWSEHMGLSGEEVGGDPAEVIDRVWRPMAREQRARAERGEPRTHRLVELAASSYRAGRLLGVLQGLVVDG
jgi:phosphatidylserine/phosphatidylglycerophosphate/cardiolipin synthase-like enzyme